MIFDAPYFLVGTILLTITSFAYQIMSQKSIRWYLKGDKYQSFQIARAKADLSLAIGIAVCFIWIILSWIAVSLDGTNSSIYPFIILQVFIAFAINLLIPIKTQDHISRVDLRKYR